MEQIGAMEIAIGLMINVCLYDKVLASVVSNMLIANTFYYVICFLQIHSIQLKFKEMSTLIFTTFIQQFVSGPNASIKS